MSAEVLARSPRDTPFFRGRVEVLTLESPLLRDNRAGDPHVRELPVYVPPVDGPLPVLFVLAGFTGRGQSFLETHPWREGIAVRYDRAVAAGESAPAILAFPDCFTWMGGSQYVNSSYLGPYEDHVIGELVALVDANFETRPGRRGVLGKSSGGFGALHLAMRHPQVFPVCASISGDCHFEYLFPGEFLAALRGLVPYDMNPRAFLDEFRRAPSLAGDGHALINSLAMAACYSPAPDSELGFELPFDLETGERVESVWRRWLEFDPLHGVERHAEALRSLEHLHVECGLTDEYHLQWALRVLVRRLEALGIAHVHEEHPGSHRGIDGRHLLLFDKLARVLTA